MRLTSRGGIMDVADPLEKDPSWQEEENFYFGRGE
jgi:hypothetical protein